MLPESFTTKVTMNILTKEVLQAIKSGLLIPSAEVVKAMADGLLEKIEPATRSKVEEISFVYNDCSWLVYYGGATMWRFGTLEEAKQYIATNAPKAKQPYLYS